MRHGLWLAALLLTGAASASAQDGGALYARYCGPCHDAGLARTPARRVLASLEPERILAALETGTMRTQGEQRTPAERRAIAAFLTGRAVGDTPPPPPLLRCSDTKPLAGAGWNGWGVTAANERFQRNPGFTAGEVPRLAVKWAFAFSGDIAAAVQPTIHGGRVFVGSAPGRVYALDLRSGCAIWTFDADTQVRTAVTIGDIGGTPTAVFGDVAATVYAVNAETGALRWKRRLDEHPAARMTGTPRLHDGRILAGVSSIEEFLAADPSYPCCTFRGSVVALDAATGSVAWKTATITEAPSPRQKNAAGTPQFGPSGAAVWATPTIDAQAGAIYVATGDAYSEPAAATTDAIVALDLKTGELRWSHQATEGDAYNLSCDIPGRANCPKTRGPDHDFGAPPILVSLGGGRRALIASQKSSEVRALDPDAGGRLLWTRRIGRGGALGGIEWGAAADERHAYVPLSDVGFSPSAPDVPLQLDSAAGGGLFALNLVDGTIAWQAPPPSCGDRKPCSPAQSAPPAAAGGVVFSGSMDGHLRAYAVDDGRVVWDFDTAREFETVNGVIARGGSIDVGGPAVAGGIVLTTSGYPQWGGMPGNVLLAFSVDGK